MNSEFSVQLSNQAVKFYKQQDKHIKERLKEALKKLKTPLKHVENFQGKYYKYRIGPYRALIDIDFKNKTVNVQVLHKRGKIYKI